MFLFAEVCSATTFWRSRPPNMKFINESPLNLCLCIYHSNFIEAADAIHKYIPCLPNYDNGFVQQFLCTESTMDCWFGKCSQCSGVTVKRIAELAGAVNLRSEAKWMIWQKNKISNRIEKREECKRLLDLIAHIVALSPQFLKHSFIKREQSNSFNKYDRLRATNIEFETEALIQIDFAENYVCEAQDEVQSAHWNQPQLSLFTSAFYHNTLFQSNVFVSNNTTHTKETIVPYLHQLLMKLPASVKILKVWSDGPSSQFKNKYIATIIPHFEKKFGIKIIWNYFATSHGKGCVDGIGATAKKVVRKHVKARDCLVNCAADFVNAFNRTESNIIVEEFTDSQFNEVNASLNATEIFLQAKNVRDIAAAHQIRFDDGKLATFTTSAQGYN